MILMFREGTRGGICIIIHRYCKVNNKYKSAYDVKKAPKFIEYHEANNLYRWALCLGLPVGKFK